MEDHKLCSTSRRPKKWSIAGQDPQVKYDDSVYKFVHFQTQGIKDHDVPLDPYYDAQRFCQILDKRFMQSLENHDSGMFWNRKQEERVRTFRLRELKPTNFVQFTELTIEDIRDAMGKVARVPKGYLVEQNSEPRLMSKTLQACHQLGLLFSKQQGPGKILYVFASPIHQRVALAHTGADHQLTHEFRLPGGIL
ncbi:MAG: hypothetical protein L6R38_004498 [Xanthoria sp. 2 TBL-2021]|nr:MAG: hypothetical protein L6R38_004498 [Xanthoria sp. 2 TBL-2021]